MKADNDEELDRAAKFIQTNYKKKKFK